MVIFQTTTKANKNKKECNCNMISVGIHTVTYIYECKWIKIVKVNEKENVIIRGMNYDVCAQL